jgi:hypothetical protein
LGNSSRDAVDRNARGHAALGRLRRIRVEGDEDQLHTAWTLPSDREPTFVLRDVLAVQTQTPLHALHWNGWKMMKLFYVTMVCSVVDIVWITFIGGTSYRLGR